MGSRKEKLKDQLSYLPDGILPLINTPIPTLQAGIWPIDDVDTAILMQGILAFNINTILKAFEGLTPVELLLRIGQNSPASQLAATRGLRVRQDNPIHDFSIIGPEEGQVFTGGQQEIPFVADNISGLEHFMDVEVTIFFGQTEAGNVVLEYDEESQESSGAILLPPAPLLPPSPPWTLQFEAEFEAWWMIDDHEFRSTKSINFSIESA